MIETNDEAEDRATTSIIPMVMDALPASPMIKPHLLHRGAYPSIKCTELPKHTISMEMRLPHFEAVLSKLSTKLFPFSNYEIRGECSYSEIVLTPFLERRFGEKIPIYHTEYKPVWMFDITTFRGCFDRTGREDFQIVMMDMTVI